MVQQVNNLHRYCSKKKIKQNHMEDSNSVLN